MEPNSNYANVSWRHNFPASSSEFVLEFTLDSKKPDRSQPELFRHEAGSEMNYETVKQLKRRYIKVDQKIQIGY